MAHRIALISEHASPAALLGGEDAGGQNVYVDALSRGLARLGHEVDVFTRRDRPDAPQVVEWAPGVRLVNLAAGAPRALPKDDLWPLMPAFRDALLAVAARERRRYAVVHGHFWMSGWVAAELRRRWGVPVVQHFHALGATKRRHQGEADTSPPERIAVETAIVRRVDRVVAQCPSERLELVEDYGAAPERVAMIPAGVDPVRFRPVDRIAARRALGGDLAPDDLVVGYVGRMLPRKDVRNVVRAVALLARHPALANRRLRLLVVGGDGPEPDPVRTPEIGAVRALAAELGIADRVLCLGQRQPDELCHCYGAADVVVSTPWYEPFGLTPLEAMACGRPVVGSAVGGIAYTVVDGETGFLVPPRDAAALADRLARLLLDPPLRDRLGRAARCRVETHFTWPTVVRRTARLYEELEAASRQPSAVSGWWGGHPVLGVIPNEREESRPSSVGRDALTPFGEIPRPGSE